MEYHVKAPFSKCFPTSFPGKALGTRLNVFYPHENRKVEFLKFLRFEERFRKAPFS